MNNLPPGAHILKSFIAPARYSDGPTLYLICSMDGKNDFVVLEQMPDGTCQVWPDVACLCAKQAEGIIYQRMEQKS